MMIIGYFLFLIEKRQLNRRILYLYLQNLQVSLIFFCKTSDQSVLYRVLVFFFMTLKLVHFQAYYSKY
jgi:hypothetical protein